jgi:poly-gamma-glutamate capsule biosynthesis protein CapA/YwtB (metallophosphatase superfamily)
MRCRETKPGEKSGLEAGSRRPGDAPGAGVPFVVALIAWLGVAAEAPAVGAPTGSPAAVSARPPAAEPTGVSPAPAQSYFDPRRPPEHELEMSVEDGFTLAAVGDCIMSRPLSQMIARDPAFAAIAKIVHDADAAFGNFEITAFDLRGFKGYPGGAGDDWSMVATPDVPRDLKAIGFDLVSRANNHALDWGLEGMRETGRLLDEAGLVHAGAGETRGEARAAGYLETASGRIGLVSVASTFRDMNSALPPHGAAPGRPGISTLRTSRTTLVTQEMFESLRSLDQAMKAPGKECYRPSREERSRPPRELRLFDTPFRIADRPGYHYEMNPIDLAEILKSVRLGKQHSDFLIFTIHAHETGLGCHEPGDFLPVLAHAVIDAGADIFIGHGEHRLMPVEIYKGRAIFYSLANFFWSDMMEPDPADVYETNQATLAAAVPDPSAATDADLNAILNADGFDDEEVFQNVLAVSRYEKGRLSEVRLQPFDLGYGRKLTKSGVPRLPTPAVARSILARLQRISRPFGTTIAIEQNVGVIRPAR